MRSLRSLSALFILLPLLCSRAGDLYTTDFEGFPVGDNLWAGTEGWIGNDLTSGAQGILEDYIDPNQLPLGKTAYLGFETPASSFTTVARPVNYDPAAAGFPCVEFESFLGVQDSLNGRRDQFFVSFYDIGGNFLAAVVFDNTSAGADMLRWQGNADGTIQSFPTGVPFIPGDPIFNFVSLQILFVRIDLANNTWTAQLDGIPLFADAPFTDPALAPLTLGSVAAEWELANPDPSFAGDNWLFVADWFVRSAPKGIEPFLIDSLTQNAAGETVVTWLGEPGFDYHIIYTDDLQTWHNDLPNSAFPGITTAQLLSYTDLATAPTLRFYKIGRSPTP